MEIAHFVVPGEAMTEAARGLLCDDEPGKAYRLLAEGLHGEGAVEAALAVLRGTHDLAGDSNVGLELVEASDTPELQRYKKDVRFIYAGRFRERGLWYRPVAWITGYGTRDGDYATKQVEGALGSPGSSALRKWWYHRAKYYCSDHEEPFLVVAQLPGDEDLVDAAKTYVVFERCGELPHWMKPPSTAQEALDDALAGGRWLEKRDPVPAKPEPRWPRPSKEELERRDDAERRLEADRQKKLKEIGEKVRKQAGEDTFELELKTGQVLKIPRAPFVRWSLHRTEEQDQAPEWDNVAPIGVKLQMDNPDHTDWVLGAGISLDEAYDDAIKEAAWDKSYEFQEEARKAKRKYAGIFAALEELSGHIHPAAVVVDAGARVGRVGDDIAVFPDSDGSRVGELGESTGVIVEKAGPIAHLVVVTKGRGITVMCHPKACEVFEDGMEVQLDPKAGRVVILEED